MSVLIPIRGCCSSAHKVRETEPDQEDVQEERLLPAHEHRHHRRTDDHDGTTARADAQYDHRATGACVRACVRVTSMLSLMEQQHVLTHSMITELQVCTCVRVCDVTLSMITQLQVRACDITVIDDVATARADAQNDRRATGACVIVTSLCR